MFDHDDLITKKGTTEYGDGYSLVDEGAKTRPSPDQCRYLDCQEPTHSWLTYMGHSMRVVMFPVCAAHSEELKSGG